VLCLNAYGTEKSSAHFINHFLHRPNPQDYQGLGECFQDTVNVTAMIAFNRPVNMKRHLLTLIRVI
jgi:hypothetical protein